MKESGQPDEPRGRRRPPELRRPGSWRRSLLLFLFCLAVYNSNLRCIGAFDSLAASFLPSASARRRAHNLRLARPPTYPEGPAHIQLVSHPGNRPLRSRSIRSDDADPWWARSSPPASSPSCGRRPGGNGEAIRLFMEKDGPRSFAPFSVLFSSGPCAADHRAGPSRAGPGLRFAPRPWVFRARPSAARPRRALAGRRLYLLLAPGPLRARARPAPRGDRGAPHGATAGPPGANTTIFFSLASLDRARALRPRASRRSLGVDRRPLGLLLSLQPVLFQHALRGYCRTTAAERTRSPSIAGAPRARRLL